jgi:hypothetical protein
MNGYDKMALRHASNSYGDREKKSGIGSEAFDLGAFSYKYDKSEKKSY